MLTPEQEWILVACGMIAHADDMLEFGEWDQILRFIDANVEDEQLQPWLDMLGDRPALEKRFAELDPPLPFFAEQLLEAAWRMALADGSGSEIEAAVHDRIAEKVGIPGHLIDGPEDLRREWFDGKKTVGVTAGASAPELLVARVVQRIKEWGGETSQELEGREENVVFSLPRELRGVRVVRG